MQTTEAVSGVPTRGANATSGRQKAKLKSTTEEEYAEAEVAGALCCLLVICCYRVFRVFTG